MEEKHGRYSKRKENELKHLKHGAEKKHWKFLGSKRLITKEYT